MLVRMNVPVPIYHLMKLLPRQIQSLLKPVTGNVCHFNFLVYSVLLHLQYRAYWVFGKFGFVNTNYTKITQVFSSCNLKKSSNIPNYKLQFTALNRVGAGTSHKNTNLYIWLRLKGVCQQKTLCCAKPNPLWDDFVGNCCCSKMLCNHSSCIMSSTLTLTIYMLVYISSLVKNH